MESQKIKENRRAKFLAKMEKQNKLNKKDTAKKPKLNSEPVSQPKDNSSSQEQNNQSKTDQSPPISKENQNELKTEINDNNNIKNFIENINAFNKVLNEKNITQEKHNDLTQNNNKSNDIKNNENNKFENNYQNEKINFEEILSKMNQMDYMIGIQNIFKKILIIILAILHCLNYAPLDNFNNIKYSLIILEITSLFFNKYYSDQKKNLTKNHFNPNINDINKGKPNNRLEKISLFLMENFGAFNNIFMFLKSLKDIMCDISILFLINIGFFLLNKKQ